ncbi:transglutaminase-like cysteine peptidase [Kordiimonas aquimaris]|uniref:transglutaminase-like cysteine peptidase n=1 Tax=Kordiimonas aquimaris TaxID=707591 RepID=UPI0021CFC089|nr:transglutaminase-like cysteine peptidase [Kordiimonas aquimaris]
MPRHMRFLLISLCLLAGFYPVGAQQAGLFGSREIRSTNMNSFDKWTELWRRHNLQRTQNEQARSPARMSAEENCRGRNRVICNRDAWESFIAEQNTAISSEASAQQDYTPVTPELLSAVNVYMNRTTYVVDPVNWGIPDYWATPDEFFMKDGDCEDYAISKYITLKRLGVDPSLMRVVVLQDENLRVAHAVLAVFYNGTFYILDNQVDGVLPHEKILHYRPVYSINESAWWLHQVRRFLR